MSDNKPPSVGLWANDNERGPVASGVSGGIRFVLWRNDKRGNDRAPDYRLVMEAPQKRDDAPKDQPRGMSQDDAYAPPDDDVPF